jgi:hypothetical protein
MSRDTGQILPYTQITPRLSLRRTAVHMPADSMSTLRPTSCAAHAECEMDGWLIVRRVRMTQNCQKEVTASLCQSGAEGVDLATRLLWL